ncbi:DUF2202 domain-containing protein [Thioflexithrix psekupsensis]|uniref:DUF2202 domain-containing protein n=1 Tax=Thioflexithrix psekupsensis TaxID=1570016 RepID=A0A251XAJ5_9GAMM|nr:DUF2202 domain-containing protein [Thioflexithrix psekupsensis]OUD15389.1 hypothetical protein TPSD3_02350 [Thioflexithrix psekupsensis]
MNNKQLLKSIVVSSLLAVALNQVVLAQQGNGQGYRGGAGGGAAQQRAGQQQAGGQAGGGNQAAEPTRTATGALNCPTPTSTSITAAEADSLGFMREEEKLARDVYLFLGEKWQLPVFDNIASSEENHTAQVKCLLDAYQLPDSASTMAGQFNNPELQNLYDQLTQRGQTSLSEALRVGALIEEVDIKDLQDALLETQTPEIRVVYQNLIAGSENHLRAFVKNLAQQGESYTAQVLPSEEVERILSNTAPNVAVFDLDRGTLSIPEIQIKQNGQLLPNEGAYHLELKAISGDTLQVIQVQRLPN